MSLRLIAEKIGYIIAHEEITVAALVKLPIHTYYSNKLMCCRRAVGRSRAKPLS